MIKMFFSDDTQTIIADLIHLVSTHDFDVTSLFYFVFAPVV